MGVIIDERRPNPTYAAVPHVTEFAVWLRHDTALEFHRLRQDQYVVVGDHEPELRHKMIVCDHDSKICDAQVCKSHGRCCWQ